MIIFICISTQTNFAKYSNSYHPANFHPHYNKFRYPHRSPPMNMPGYPYNLYHPFAIKYGSRYGNARKTPALKYHYDQYKIKYGGNWGSSDPGWKPWSGSKFS